jgi:diguanylate cyclase (GGDEF)-like protein/PAS domain S-box-containing protein
MLKRAVLRGALLLLAALACPPLLAETRLSFGVHSSRPKAVVEAAWQPFIDYLNASLDGVHVELRALDDGEASSALAQGKLDLLLTNPAHFIALRASNPLSGAIATLVGEHEGQPLTEFGGVILVRAADRRFATLADLAGKRIGTTQANFLGTYPAQAFELHAAGTDPASLRILPLGQSHDSVIDAVLDARVDAGFVRTGLLERLTAEGRDLSALRVLNPQTWPGFPLHSSTRLYPEWPLVALSRADQAVVRRIVALALSLDAAHPAARAARIHGFTIAADYSAVEEVLRTLRVAPFDASPAFTWNDVWTRYKDSLFALSLALVTIVLLLVRLTQRNLALSRANDASQRLAAEVELERHHLRNVVEATQAGSWEWNLETGEWRADARWAQILGLDSSAHITGERSCWRTRVHPDDLAEADEELERHIRGETPFYEQDLRLRHHDEHWVWVHDRALAVRRDADGRALLLTGAQVDISRRKASEDKLRLAASVFSSSYEAIVITDADNRIVDVNPAFCRITGYSREESLGRDPGMLNSGRQSREFYRAMWQSLEANDHWQGELWNRRKDGGDFAEVLSISRVRDAKGRITHHLAMFSDISRLKQHEEELNRIAYFDPLTGAPNRRLLDDRLRQAIAHARRTRKPLAVCVIDLDGFKPINDQYGHEAGDQVLVAIVDRLNAILRASDTVARLGGDEFVLLLEDMESKRVLERVLEAIRAPLQLASDQVSVSASIGVTLFPEDDADSETLLRHADQAMYRAKQRGRNCIQFFDAEVETQQRIRKQRVDRLEQALSRQEFVLHYQPQVDMIDGRALGMEALLRWQHPDRGLLAPAEFLPDLEGSELEKRLGQWVIDSALGQLERCRDAGLDLSVSVNVGARPLLMPGFVADVRSALERHPDIPPSRLELEILESTALDDVSLAMDVLDACRRLGVRIALDDFGTGYASLRHLRQLPVDRLKIDRSFVLDMLDDKDARAIVAAVVQLARTFDREVIAEGVETPAHAAALIALGCRLGQGYGIARPMPAAHVTGWFSWQTLPPFAEGAAAGDPPPPASA